MGDRYLERNYDSGKEEQQEESDRKRAAYIEKKADELETDKRNELVRNELDYEEWDDAEAVDGLFSNYGMNLKEYLVDGAILTCNRATSRIMTIKGVEFGPGGEGIQGDRKKTRLTIPYSGTTDNGSYMATVKDHKIGENIQPFECNCQNPPDRAEEMDAIFSDLEDCVKLGTCRKLMKLENDWENMISETDYLTCSTGDGEKIEKITRMSMLFCSHGGLITPVTSGQKSGLWYVTALVCEAGRELPFEQKKRNAIYVYNYFSNLGWSEQAICGILGNMQVESGINPAIWSTLNDEKGTYGIVQWATSADFLKSIGLSANEVNSLAEQNPKELMDIQLEYIVGTIPYGKNWYINLAEKYYDRYPLRGGTSGNITGEAYTKLQGNIGDMALIFAFCYERPEFNDEKTRMRIRSAYKWSVYFDVMEEANARKECEEIFGVEWGGELWEKE